MDVRRHEARACRFRYRRESAAAVHPRSSPRCTRGPTTRTSARSSRGSSGRSPSAGTRSSASSPRDEAAANAVTCYSRGRCGAPRSFEPDVVYAHFLVPTGLSAALFGGAPLVVTAHGRDVRNIGAYPGIRAATRFVARKASSLIAVSDYLRRELEAKIPEARGKTEVVDCGVDLELFTGPGPVTTCWKWAGFRLRRELDRAEERRPARRRLRHARRRAPRLRRRRPSPLGARGPAERRDHGPRSARGGAALPRRGDRPLPAVAHRAVRPGPARGHGLADDPSSQPASAGRPSSCRRKPGCSSIPWTRRRSRTGCGEPQRCHDRTPRRRRPPPSTTSGVRRSGSSRSWKEPLEVGQPDLDQRPHASPRDRSRARARVPVRSSRVPSPARRPA